jgi:dTMP kinase
LGVLCRSALRGQLQLDRHTLALAFTADRSHHLYSGNGIMMHRHRGDWIVQDRYLYSTLAYQDGPDREWLRGLNTLFPRPDLVVFLDTPVDVCLERIDSRGKTAEIFEERASMERIVRSYHEVFEHEAGGAPVLALDGAAPPREIHGKIIERIEGWIAE